jgi:hypothetical protein
LFEIYVYYSKVTYAPGVLQGLVSLTLAKAV